MSRNEDKHDHEFSRLKYEITGYATDSKLDKLKGISYMGILTIAILLFIGGVIYVAKANAEDFFQDTEAVLFLDYGPSDMIHVKRWWQDGEVIKIVDKDGVTYVTSPVNVLLIKKPKKANGQQQ